MKKKKTTTPLTRSSDEANASLAPASTAALNELPVIKIVSTEDEVFTKMNLEMEDETHDMLVKWGKKVATDEDYIGIAIRTGLEEYVDALDNKQK